MDSGRWVCWGKLWNCGKWHQHAWCSPPARWHLCLNSNSELHLSPWFFRRKKMVFLKLVWRLQLTKPRETALQVQKLYDCFWRDFFWMGLCVISYRKKGVKPGKCCNHGSEHRRGGLVSQQPFVVEMYLRLLPRAVWNSSVIPQHSREPGLPLSVKSKAQC